MKLEDLKGIGKKTLGYLSKLDIHTIADLLTHFPKRYEDRRQCRSIREAISENNEKYPVQIKVLGHDFFYAGRKKTLKIIITDGFMRASLVCFNRDFLKDVFEVDKEFIVIGDFQYKYNEVQSSSFEFTPLGVASESLNFMRIVPIYALTDGISQGLLRDIIEQSLSALKLSESLPQWISDKYNFMSKKEALRQIHFPDDFEKLEQAKFRLKYYELFELECNVALKKHFFTFQRKNRYTHNNNLISKFLEQLPFQLTSGQRSAFEEIKQDLFSEYPMHRLLQGDVGSGKTVVAILTMLMAVENNFQASLMVPTEVLAKQHFKTLSHFLKDLPIKLTLFTGSTKGVQRKEALYKINENKTHIIIGTHALFSEDVKYHNLGLVVIDEQHKFGVEERIQLVEKGDAVDILVMTATPIPRSLSLTVYGDLDVSIIREKPQIGVEVKSRVIVNEDKRKTMYNFIDTEIEKGRQGFVVCPLIEESEKLEAKSTQEIFEEIQSELLPHRKIALLHGKHTSIEKEEKMQYFMNGDYDILVSTTVIEVGVDVPNASFMIVENADRFGLSQLHQLRGRIGRGKHHSYCFFTVPGNISEDGKKRMNALVKHHDGFLLSEEDLKIRGPGEFLGTKQSGLDSLKLANLIDDEELLLMAKEDAFKLVYEDPYFKKEENLKLQHTIYRRFEEKHKMLLRN